MEYKASLDTLTKIVTASVFVLLSWISYECIKEIPTSQLDIKIIFVLAGTPFLVISTLVICFLYATKSYTVNDTYIAINRIAGSKKINMEDIKEIKALESSELSGTIRTFGNGGFFGYYGKFWNRKIGKMTWYVTQRKNYVLIKTQKGQSLIISPDNNMGLIQDVNEKLTKISLRTNRQPTTGN